MPQAYEIGGVAFFGAPPSPYPDTAVTRLAFLNRLTSAERIAIRTAAKSSAEVEDYMAMVDAATFIDLARADTIAGIQALEQAGLIGPGRSGQILGAPIQSAERPI